MQKLFPEGEDKILLGAFAEDLFDLAFLHSTEPSQETIESLRSLNFPSNLGVVLKSKRAADAKGSIIRGLTGLPKEMSEEILEIFAVDYADIYLNHTFAASPVESVWIDEDNLALQEPTFQVRSFYKEFDVQAKNWRMRSEDHLVSELEFVSVLLSAEGLKECSYGDRIRSAARFLDEHMLRWVPLFAEKIASRCTTEFFSGLNLLTLAYLEELREFLEDRLGEKRPSSEEIERRMRPEKLVHIGAPKFVPGVSPSW